MPILRHKRERLHHSSIIYFDTLLPTSQDQTWKKLYEEVNFLVDWHGVSCLGRWKQQDACEQFTIMVAFLLVGRGDRIWHSVWREVTWSNQVYFHILGCMLHWGFLIYSISNLKGWKEPLKSSIVAAMRLFSLWIVNLYNYPTDIYVFVLSE